MDEKNTPELDNGNRASALGIDAISRGLSVTTVAMTTFVTEMSDGTKVQVFFSQGMIHFQTFDREWKRIAHAKMSVEQFKVINQITGNAAFPAPGSLLRAS